MDACICLDRGKPPAHSVLPPAQNIDPESLIMPGKIIKQKIKVIYMSVYPPFGQGGGRGCHVHVRKCVAF